MAPSKLVVCVTGTPPRARVSGAPAETAKSAMNAPPLLMVTLVKAGSEPPESVPPLLTVTLVRVALSFA